jgi:hypothetical protein
MATLKNRSNALHNARNFSTCKLPFGAPINSGVLLSKGHIHQTVFVVYKSTQCGNYWYNNHQRPRDFGLDYIIATPFSFIFVTAQFCLKSKKQTRIMFWSTTQADLWISRKVSSNTNLERNVGILITSTNWSEEFFSQSRYLSTYSAVRKWFASSSSGAV